MYTFNSIYTHLLKYKKQLIFANILAVLAVLANTPIPLIIPMLIDEILLNKPGFVTNTVNYFFETQNIIFYVFFALFMTISLRSIFVILEYFQTKIFTKVSKKITFQIRSSILKHLEKISLSEYEFFGSGKAASLMVTDVETVDEFISNIASYFVSAILHVIFIAIVLFYLSWQMALLIFILNPIVIIITTKLSKKIAFYKKEQNQAYQSFQEDLSETLNQFTQVRASNQEKKFVEKLIYRSDILKKTATKFTYKKFGANSFSMLLLFGAFDLLRVCAILIVAIYNEMTIGQIFAIFSYLHMVARPMEYVVSIQYSYHSAKVALSRINQIFALKQEPQYACKKNPFREGKTNSIELKNAIFSYDGIKNVLNNINIKIEKGKKVAFVGKSGGGKTTLAQIIVGFYPLKSGELLFDDIKVEDIGLNTVRENVFLVLQNPEMFNDSIKYNLTLGKEIEEVKIWNALKTAQLYDLIKNLPQQLNTRVGNHGMKLSGGQRQRLSIARMILQNPNIVILDESTSALDNDTETRLYKALESFLKDKTTIIIAHRLSTIKDADKIFLFKDGKIDILNSYEELINKEYEYEN